MSAARERVLLVTNRAPVTFARAGDGLRVSRGAGGVVSALRDLVRLVPVTWVAAAAGEGDLLAARSQRDRGGLLGSGRLTLRLVPMGARLFADYYDGFSNRVLWFAQHGLWSMRIDPEPPRRLRRLAERYAEAGRLIADALAREAHRVGQARAVLLHDYHLYRVPPFLRERVPGLVLSHFVHVPWPTLDAWREAMPDEVLLPLVRGLLAADVVGFQNAASRDRFAACVGALVPDARAREDEVRHRGGRTALRVRPVSVDPSSIRPSPRLVDELRRDGRLLVARVDRADPIKNVPAGFVAFERLLERRPDLVGRVRFRARVVPSRGSLPEYARERDAVRAAAARLAARFGAGTIELVERADRGRALAELAAADVVLVNSVVDGMNLVAKEAAVANERGALVLSRGAGAYAELRDGALGIDPLDVDGTAAALERGLEMAEGERRTRAAMLRAAVRRWTARDWVRSQLDDVEDAAARRPPLAAAV